ncbi:unnamed protein product [Notodromas monacha]|uniref:Arrestin C-terminal-like domain-containing protein n=1 Tax=Notodromas monacha TaxID=399045 RepID=A0A7R9GH24_9CRUS|nr:unnamed protein product [Notodromas monacha]CAG0920474.1 unnamed protein product [Notodromas monacha]
MVTLSISFSGNHVVYAGQVVSGKVTVLKVPGGCRLLTLTLLGQGKTSWTEQESRYDSVTERDVVDSVHCGKTEDYFIQPVCLWTESSGVLLHSAQEFSFSFMLPPDLPPSFHGSYGSIEYTLTAVLERQDASTNKTAVATLIVIPQCSMGHLKEMMKPVTMEAEKKLKMLLIKQGYVSATVTLPRAVYILGEVIPVSASILNQSSVSLGKTKAKLVQTVTFHADSKSKVEKLDLCKVKRGEVAAGTTFEWTKVPVDVPNNAAPSDFGPRCTLFRAEHKLEFSVHPAGLHSALELAAALKLGTVWEHLQPVLVPQSEPNAPFPLPTPVPIINPPPFPLPTPFPVITPPPFPSPTPFPIINPPEAPLATDAGVFPPSAPSMPPSYETSYLMNSAFLYPGLPKE